jgi:cell division protein FtsL
MLKLLVCLISSVLIGVLMLHLRQQRLELNHRANLLHNQIEAQQARLWNQQLQIAVYTAPNAISKTVGDHSLKLVPQSPARASNVNWMDVRGESKLPVTD